jgi:hypothetical protein
MSVPMPITMTPQERWVLPVIYEHASSSQQSSQFTSERTIESRHPLAFGPEQRQEVQPSPEFKAIPRFSLRPVMPMLAGPALQQQTTEAHGQRQQVVFTDKLYK